MVNVLILVALDFIKTVLLMFAQLVQLIVMLVMDINVKFAIMVMF